MHAMSSHALASDPAPGLQDRPGLRRAAVYGVGADVPEGVLTNADLERIVDTSDTWILERTGIRQRHRVASGETSASMGARAAAKAMAMAGRSQVDAVIVATCSPDTFVPATASLLVRELGLPGTPPIFDINAACSGWTYGVQLATSLIASSTADTVLVVCTEAMTRLVDFGDRSTCVLFGDGAGATVLGVAGDSAVRSVRWGADTEEAEIIYYGPKQEDEAGPDGLRMAGRGTFRLAVDRLCAMAEELAADCGWALADVEHVVPHQANQRIIEAAAKRLGIAQERLVLNVSEVGNTSAASIPLALADAHAAGRLHRGDRVVAVAFGAGATWGGVAFEWAI